MLMEAEARAMGSMWVHIEPIYTYAQGRCGAGQDHTEVPIPELEAMRLNWHGTAWANEEPYNRICYLQLCILQEPNALSWAPMCAVNITLYTYLDALPSTLAQVGRSSSIK